jgi:hypothetical protein
MTEMSEDLRGKQSPCTLIKVFFLIIFRMNGRNGSRSGTASR